ncbi:long-chain fatty acid--CoA ligase [Cytobacillus horneckiae]|uniref:acyl-CoA synthetase n=1 Tax=Cytobacillus horneckiae TaxID=549687 RepID=UPI00203C49C0|nr:long-chain fatty acid--CoA ligase [Cytobacillus horneckiae]MCM3178007.1 long-chain fatty acid--CoA ligase [Cytobacillus horneckiae]
MTTSGIHTSRQLLMGELIRRVAHKTPKQPAFVYENTKITYEDMERRVLHLAGWLQKVGIEIGEKIGIISKNNLSFVEIVFAVASSGAVSVPINFRLAADEFAYVINNSDTKILFIEKEYEETIRLNQHQMPNLEKVVIIDTNQSEWAVSYPSIFEDKVTFNDLSHILSDDDDCMICYTSGTTGFPKGAVLSHKNLLLSALNSIVDSKIANGNKQLTITPLFHIAGIGNIIISCTVGGTTYIQREFNPVHVLETIHKEQIVGLFLVPAMWNMIMQVPTIEKYDLTSVERCSTGAAICPLVTKKQMMKHFPNAGIFDAFGQTEMSPTTTCLLPEDSLRKTNSVGKPVLNVEVRVVDENMNDVPLGEIGEIVYRGPTLMKGYYKNPEATEEAFKGGWFHSGDLVQMDDEGFIYVVDRKKDMIISGGENIYPAEIEAVLYKHESILEAAVVGVADEKWGESVKAYVVLKKGKELGEEEIIAFCKEHLASYKKPKYVEFINELPRNPSGKILKRILREGAKVTLTD